MTTNKANTSHRADWYTFTLADGRTVSGRIQGCGGTIPADRHAEIQGAIDRANEGEPIGIYEPRPGHACLKYYNPQRPDRRVEIDLRGAELWSADDVAMSVRAAMRRYGLTRGEAIRYVLAPDTSAVTRALHAWRESAGFPADSSALTRGKLLELVSAAESYAHADSLFVGTFATGISYADRSREKSGDYLRVAFLSFRTLRLEWSGAHVSPEMRAAIEVHAAGLQARRGESYQVSTCGQTVLLGERAS